MADTKAKEDLSKRKGFKIVSSEDNSEKISERYFADEYTKRKEEKKRKRKVLTISVIVAIIVFFTFGFVARPIFGADHPITQIAEDNIIAAINIFAMVENSIDAIVATLSTLFISLVVIYALLGITKLSGRGSNRRRTISRLIASFIKYIGFLVVFMMLLSAIGVDTSTILASVGVLGIVIGFGAQSLINNILAGIFIVFENNFQVGDIITVEGFRGEVIDIGLRTTQVKDVGGDVLIINNGELRRFVNLSQHSSFAICDITIEYGESIEKVEKIIAANIGSIAMKLPKIIEGPFYRGLQQFTERGTLLRIVARCEEIDRLQLTRDFQREMKLLFDKHNIKVAVPKVHVEGGTAIKTKK